MLLKVLSKVKLLYLCLLKDSLHLLIRTNLPGRQFCWTVPFPINYRGQPKAGTGYKMLLVPFVFSMSRFQGPSFRCNRIVVIVTLLEAIEGIPDSTKIIIFEGTKTSTIFTRDYFMSENLRVDI